MFFGCLCFAYCLWVLCYLLVSLLIVWFAMMQGSYCRCAVFCLCFVVFLVCLWFGWLLWLVIVVWSFDAFALRVLVIYFVCLINLVFNGVLLFCFAFIVCLLLLLTCVCLLIVNSVVVYSMVWDLRLLLIRLFMFIYRFVIFCCIVCVIYLVFLVVICIGFVFCFSCFCVVECLCLFVSWDCLLELFWFAMPFDGVSCLIYLWISFCWFMSLWFDVIALWFWFDLFILFSWYFGVVWCWCLGIWCCCDWFIVAFAYCV